ncbi:hypothetical protein [Flavobacterium sp. A45]|uniref:hypothetical protein n=1 Tax=Flavobacterium sp. A45 TaxID=1945862 RepID=UPI000986262A|nr:hypothetical protein [Flavobacterium sp. A45]OOG68137.1 hypothetical protein B0E44_13355 [Flavobacterium sp. A45]
METEKIGAYKSQDKKYAFDFIFEGEIRFGPTYYKIKLNGQLIANRIFGLEFKWHPNSTFLALQEWLTIDYQKGPITALTLIDLEKGKFARISTADKGFIKPIKFNNDIIIFEKEYLANGKIVEYEIKFNEIKNWE